MRTKTLLTVAVAASVGAGAILSYHQASAQSWKAGAQAPDFTAKGSDGKTHSLKSLTAKGPFVLYFIGRTCPVNAKAVPYYNKVAQAYGDKVPIVGVINGDEAQYKEWQREFKSPFTVLYDPQMKIIKAYRAERSPWLIMVGKNGKIAKEWIGYSVGELDELSASIAGANKAKVQKLDFSGAPASPRYG